MLIPNQEKIERLFKTPFFKYFLPVSLTVISAYFWVNFIEINFIKIIGLTINMLGLIMWWTGKLTLAQNWNVGFGKPKLSQLVTHGIYSKVRHPMYWGINLTLVGLALIYPKIWFIVISLIVIFYFIFRMKRENKYLMETLGEEYQNYKNKTWI